MIIIARKKNLSLAAMVVVALLGLLVLKFGFFSRPASGNMDYRVFVAGVGTIEGKWSGETGIVIVGLETRPAAEAEKELKVIDLLVANNGSEQMLFNSDIAMIDKTGRRFGLTAEGQPEVSINPGSLSHGTVIISVPKGVPDSEWILEVKGGNLPESVLLPLRILKVTELNPE